MHCRSVSNCLAVSLLTESMTSAYHHVYFCHFSNKLTQKNTLKKKSKYLTQQLTSVRSLGIVNWLQTRKTILFQVKFSEKSVIIVDGQAEEQLWLNQSPLVRSTREGYYVNGWCIFGGDGCWLVTSSSFSKSCWEWGTDEFFPAISQNV